MGASYDSNPRRDSGYDSNHRPPWNPSDADRVNDRLSGLVVSESSDTSSNVYQVLRAVEVAEDTIKQQMEEKLQLQDQLLRLEWELEKYKPLESTSGRPAADDMRDVHSMGPYRTHISNIPGGNEVEKVRWMESNPSMNPRGTLLIHQNGAPELDKPVLGTSTGNQRYSESTNVNGSLKISTGMQTGVDNAGVSKLSTPSSTSLSPTRCRKEREYDPQFNLSGQGLIPVSETSSNNLWKQDLSIKVREHEEEIAMLRKHLADYSVKEAQICNEKYILEKRIAYMRMAFDQQQQDLVDAASKALSYRQDIMEENIHLTYALQAVQQERTAFVSSLVPLLTEYNLQPSVLDAQSIVSNLKVLFKHLQEKLILSEDKLKESQYQLAPWPAEVSNNTSFPPQPPSRSFGAPIPNSNNSLEIVPQSAYSHAQSPISSLSNAQTKLDCEAVGNQNHNPGPSGFVEKHLDQDGLERIPLTRNTIAHDTLAKTRAHDTSAQVTQSDSHVARFSVEFKDQNPSFNDLVRRNEIDDPEPSVLKHGREGAVHWGPGTSAYLPSGLDDPNSYPYLPPVLEEPSSSFSEAAEDDPLPAIEGLQITGDAFPGRVLQASGYQINGTTSCNFEWVRYLEDGSVNYIEGAKQPKYLLTADDVDSCIAIEVHPLDDRKRKGELVKVFVNEQRKITCDPEMQEQIEKTFSIGHISYDILLSAKYLDIWEQAVLAIKREGYSIKCNGPRGVVIAEKFLPTTAISIPYGHHAEFSIQCTNGDEYLLRANDSSWSRDTIVLTMRLFKKMAVSKRKGRKKGLFFKS